jgi:hypothetical protein
MRTLLQAVIGAAMRARRHLLGNEMAAVAAGVLALIGCQVPAGPRGGGEAARPPGAQLWVARFRAGGFDLSGALAVSAGGRRVFVTGESNGGRAAGDEYATVAYSAVTGRQLWFSRYRGPGKNADAPAAVAVSPDGRRVFVTGYSVAQATGFDYATVAYSAATGRQLWASRYDGSGNYDAATALAVSPAGGRVFVTGESDGGAAAGLEYATVAYSAVTGRQLWVSRYRPGNGADYAAAVTSAGGRVFVTGYSHGPGTGADYATVAYSAATGRQLWASRYNGPGNGPDLATAIAVSPAGGRVFVTGQSQGPGAGDSYATVAYSAAAGRQLWVSRRDGGLSVAVSPDGATVYATGPHATAAISAAAGRQLWAASHDNGGAPSVTVNPDGATVYVTAPQATVAYSAAAGRQLWASHYNGEPASAAVSPDGLTVYVTGWTERQATGYYHTTVAYRG